MEFRIKNDFNLISLDLVWMIDPQESIVMLEFSEAWARHLGLTPQLFWKHVWCQGDRSLSNQSMFFMIASDLLFFMLLISCCVMFVWICCISICHILLASCCILSLLLCLVLLYLLRLDVAWVPCLQPIFGTQWLLSNFIRSCDCHVQDSPSTELSTIPL